jgi:hypothetical protein
MGFNVNDNFNTRLKVLLLNGYVEQGRACTCVTILTLIIRQYPAFRRVRIVAKKKPISFVMYVCLPVYICRLGFHRTDFCEI